MSSSRQRLLRLAPLGVVPIIVDAFRVAFPLRVVWAGWTVFLLLVGVTAYRHARPAHPFGFLALVSGLVLTAVDPLTMWIDDDLGTSGVVATAGALALVAGASALYRPHRRVDLYHLQRLGALVGGGALGVLLTNFRLEGVPWDDALDVMRAHGWRSLFIALLLVALQATVYAALLTSDVVAERLVASGGIVTTVGFVGSMLAPPAHSLLVWTVGFLLAQATILAGLVHPSAVALSVPAQGRRDDPGLGGWAIPAMAAAGIALAQVIGVSANLAGDLGLLLGILAVLAVLAWQIAELRTKITAASVRHDGSEDGANGPGASAEVKTTATAAPVRAPDPTRIDLTDGALFQRAVTDALRRDQLALHYQPIVRLHDGAVAGYEALIRWEREPGTFVAGGELSAAAQAAGVDAELTCWVARRLAADAAALLSTVRTDEAFLSFNVGTHLLERPDVVEDLLRWLATAGTDRDAFVVEITERDPVRSWDGLGRALDRLQHEGVFVALDDFGKGFANLVNLDHLDVDLLKIDKSIVRSWSAGEERGLALLRHAVSLSQALGIQVVAEGIEDAALIAPLGGLGVVYAQGFALGRPVPVDHLLGTAAADSP